MVAVAVCCIAGVVQFAAMSVYGDLATRPSFPASLSPRLGLLLARPLGAPYLPAFLRSVDARALLHAGDVAAAASLVAGLPDGIETAELRGQLAQRAGRPAQALHEFITAGDFERAQRLIDERVAAGDAVQGAELERDLTGVLAGDARATVRARALWRWGQITQIEATGDPMHRTALQRASLDLYARALALAPNEETYLLAAGEQALTIGDKPLAAQYYARALEVVPASLDARIGLARARS